MQTGSQSKSLWGGELGLIGALGLLGLLCIYVGANTVEPAYAFHMGLAVIAAALGIFAIFQRFGARPAEPPPLEIGGLPNYNFAPVKVATSGASPGWPPASTSPSRWPIPASISRRGSTSAG